MPASSPIRAGIAAWLLSALLLVPAARAQGPDWPRQFRSAGGSFIVYQPQPEGLIGNVVTARAAFSLRKADSTSATYGVLWFQAHVRIDRDSLTVTESNLDVTRVRLPGATDADEARYERLVEAEATGWDLSGSLEELRAGLSASARERLSVENLDHTPPRVLFSTRRALLVSYDGPPQLEPIEGSPLKRVANTPFAVVCDSAASTYYLNGANLWYSAAGPLGPWSVLAAPPAAVAAVVPPDTMRSDQVAGAPPVVITATEPTELVVTDGEPLLEPLVRHDLFYVSNTESDVVRDATTQTVYVLLSGRWYTARGLDDPWVYVPADELPAIFKEIPPLSPKGNLLASVAGTDAADDAVADDQIPQTSEIARTDHGVTIEWDGPPQFDPIPGSTLRYGVNTDAQVVFTDDRYFLCDQGVWYVAADPNGPWTVSDVRPEGLDDLEPGCPVYNLRYVEIYDVTPDMVEVGYLPGYLGFYPCRGTVVYGTGYRYRPWRGRARYFARPCTWGFHARYNPWLSRWSFGITYWSGFLRVGLRWGAQPGMGHARRRAPWLGPGGFHRPLIAEDRSMVRYRTRTRARLDPLTPANLYTRSDNMKRSARPGSRPPFPRSVGAGRPVRVPNNIYAGTDGRVYQRAADGQWKVNQGRRWLPTPMPAQPSPPVVPVRGSDDGGRGATPRGGVPRPNTPPVPSPGEQGILPLRPTSPGRTPPAPLPTQPVPEPTKPAPLPMPAIPVAPDPVPVPANPAPPTAEQPAPEPVPVMPPRRERPVPTPGRVPEQPAPTPVPEQPAPLPVPTRREPLPVPTLPAPIPVPAQPAPLPVPSPRPPVRQPEQPQRPPVSAPVAPPPANSPGPLERDFRARARTSTPAQPVAQPVAQPAPAKPATPPAPARRAPAPAPKEEPRKGDQ
jgi:hypothetical protein